MLLQFAFSCCVPVLFHIKTGMQICVGVLSLINKCLCGWFSYPRILITTSGMGGVAIKGMGAVAQDWSIPEV